MHRCVQHDKIILKAECCVSDGSGNPPTIPIDGDCSGQRDRLLSGHAHMLIIKIKKGKMMTHLTLCNKSDGIIL